MNCVKPSPSSARSAARPCLSKSGQCLKSVSANIGDHPACADGCELDKHVHDDALDCLACYYGEPDQFSPPRRALNG